MRGDHKVIKELYGGDQVDLIAKQTNPPSLPPPPNDDHSTNIFVCVCLLFILLKGTILSLNT